MTARWDDCLLLVAVSLGVLGVAGFLFETQAASQWEFVLITGGLLGILLAAWKTLPA